MNLPIGSTNSSTVLYTQIIDTFWFYETQHSSGLILISAESIHIFSDWIKLVMQDILLFNIKK